MKQTFRRFLEMMVFFILRRKKEEVLLDLPSKVEEKLICELSKDQMTLYNKLVNAYKKGLINDLKDESKSVSYIHVFSLLIACS